MNVFDACIVTTRHCVQFDYDFKLLLDHHADVSYGFIKSWSKLWTILPGIYYVSIINAKNVLTPNILFQHISVPQVFACLGTGTDGRLHSRIPFWVPLAILVANEKCIWLLQVPGTSKWWTPYCPIFLCIGVWLSHREYLWLILINIELALLVVILKLLEVFTYLHAS